MKSIILFYCEVGSILLKVIFCRNHGKHGNVQFRFNRVIRYSHKVDKSKENVSNETDIINQINLIVFLLDAKISCTANGLYQLLTRAVSISKGSILNAALINIAWVYSAKKRSFRVLLYYTEALS